METLPLVESFLALSRVVHYIRAERDGSIRICCPAVPLALKVREADLIGRPLWEYLTDADATSFRARVERGESSPEQPVLLNFVDAETTPYTLACHVDVQADHFTLIGESIGSDNHTLQTQPFPPNNQLAILARERARISKLQSALTIEDTAEVARRRLSEERYRIVSELSSDYACAMVVTTEYRLAREWTIGAYSRITGFTPEEVDERGGFLTLIHPDDAPSMQQCTARLLRGQTVEAEFRIITRHDDTRWLSVRLIPVWDEERKQVSRIYSIGRDVTEQKVAAHDVQRTLDAELALRIEQARLEGVRLTAVELSDRINNLLAVAVGLLELANIENTLPADVSARIVQSLAMINQAAHYITRLHHVVRVKTKETVAGPALDLDQSV